MPDGKEGKSSLLRTLPEYVSILKIIGVCWFFAVVGATKASLLKYVKKSGNLSRVYLRKAFWLFTLITDETEEDFQVTQYRVNFKYSYAQKGTGAFKTH